MQDNNQKIVRFKPNLKPDVRYSVLTKDCFECGGVMYPFDHYSLSVRFSGYVCINCGRMIYDKERLKNVS